MQEFGTGAGFSGVNNQQFANPQPVQPLRNPYEVYLVFFLKFIVYNKT